DVITLGAVLEHVHRPHQIIGAAVQGLAPGGRLVVSVPNIDSWGFRYFQPDWWGLHLPHHLLHFNQATLRRLLEAHGLDVGEVRLVKRPSWMRRSLTAARKRGDTRYLVKVSGGRLANSLLTRWAAWRHQADALVAMAYRPAAAVGLRAA